jgi:peptidoglycan/xylan/chitin deacetylase (PgdA/CDA1 family)
LNHGVFLISLDFELFWGVRDCYSLEQYDTRVEAVHQIIPRLVAMFDANQIQATFASVGMLMANDKTELELFAPHRKPAYSNKHLSPYNGYLSSLNESKNPIHFAPNLIDCIIQSGKQELGTHTFSHYYCLEDGQSAEDFEEDLKAAIKIATSRGIALKTLVFPRNQYNKQYLEICKKHGIIAYRGNEQSWIYSARNDAGETSLRRAFRLLDSYVNLSGNHTYSLESVKSNTPYDLRSSRFLRPVNASLNWLEPLRLKRIKNAMTGAAKSGEVFHLWWHPHNFGHHTEANFAFLEKILKHYLYLNQLYGFKSLSMAQVAESLSVNHE